MATFGGVLERRRQLSRWHRAQWLVSPGSLAVAIGRSDLVFERIGNGLNDKDPAQGRQRRYRCGHNTYGRDRDVDQGFRRERLT